MKLSRSYKFSLSFAVTLHVFLLIFLAMDQSMERPVEVRAKTNTSDKQLAMDLHKQEAKAIQAVTVDSKEVMEEINRLKNIKARKRQAELDRQLKLKREADLAKRRALAEQKRVVAMKKEAARLEKEKQRRLLDEKKRMQELVDKKREQEKRLAEMREKQENLQKQQALEAKKLAEIKNKKAEEFAKIERAREERIKAELARQQQEEARKKAIFEKAEQERIAGVVDKYKALILNSISQKWILPENANSLMYSQFRICLAPNGVVLDVSLIKSSGDTVLDRSAKDAIYKASPLPVPNDPKTFNLFRDISLTVRPGNARG